MMLLKPGPVAQRQSINNCMKRSKVKCDKCNEKFSKSNISRHVAACTGPKHPKVRGIDYDPNAGYKDGSRNAWNKGLTIDTSNIVKQYVTTRKENYKNGKFKLGGWKHSDNTKHKLSELKTQFLQENPDKVPYIINHHSRKQSYPEKYWEDVLINANIDFISEFRIGIYSLDFAIIDLKLDIEIDGEQHYVDDRIVQSDIRRNEYLKNLGWKIIRIRWADFMKLRQDDKEQFVESILQQIR